MSHAVFFFVILLMNPHKKTKNPRVFSRIPLLSTRHLLADSDLVEHFSEELGTHFLDNIIHLCFPSHYLDHSFPTTKAEVIHSIGSFSPQNPESSEKVPSRFPEKPEVIPSPAVP